MVLLNLRLRQNREAYDEDLRANKKVFEREQLQIANMPKVEMPPNDKVQAIAYQFNKDIENVKNALNDGLTDMNAPENLARGFADFSKVSLAWNKLIARINPYLKGQQLPADVNPPTAGDYAFVRKTLYESLFPFFTNAVLQIQSWKDGIQAADENATPIAQNEKAVKDIIQQLDTGFYKNVSYGTEARSRIAAERLPDAAAAAAAANIGAAPQQPPAAAQFGVPAAQAQPAQPAPAAAAGGADVEIGQVNQEAMDEFINPYEEDDQLTDQQNQARQQELAGINTRIMGDINAYEFNGDDITQANDRARNDAWDADTIDEVQQFFNFQTRQEAVDDLAEMVRNLGNIRQQAQIGAQPAAPAGQAAAAAPAQQQGAVRGARAAAENARRIQQYIIDNGYEDIFEDYAQMPEGQRRQLAGEVGAVAAGMGISYQRVRKYLMTGQGMTGSGFFGNILSSLAGDALGAVGRFAAPVVGSYIKNKLTGGADLEAAAMKGFGVNARGKPLRLANSFTGNSTDPNTLADLKQRYKGKQYIGDSTGVIMPNLFNRGILGSGACCDECAAGRSCGGARCCFNARFCKGTEHYKKDKPDNWKPSKRPTAQGVKTRRREWNELVRAPAGQAPLVWKKTPVVIQEEGHRRKKRSDAGKPRNRVVGSGMTGGSNAEVEVNVKYAKLPKALQPTPEDLMPKVRSHSAPTGGRRRRLPKESYEGYDGDANDAYAVYGNMSGLGKQEESEMLQSEMLQDKALGLLKGLPRRLGVEDPKLKNKK